MRGGVGPAGRPQRAHLGLQEKWRTPARSGTAAPGQPTRPAPTAPRRPGADPAPSRPPPLRCPRTPPICPWARKWDGRGPRRRRQGLSSAPPASRGSLLGRRAGACTSFPRPSTRGSVGPASLSCQVLPLPEITRAGRGAPAPGVPTRGTRRRLAPTHPSKVKRWEGGRPRLARNVRRSPTQTMTPLPPSPSPRLASPRTHPAARAASVRDAPDPTSLSPQAGDARRPGAVPAAPTGSAHTFPS